MSSVLWRREDSTVASCLFSRVTLLVMVEGCSLRTSCKFKSEKLKTAMKLTGTEPKAHPKPKDAEGSSSSAEMVSLDYPYAATFRPLK